jgi:hypothetical protein
MQRRRAPHHRTQREEDRPCTTGARVVAAGSEGLDLHDVERFVKSGYILDSFFLPLFFFSFSPVPSSRFQTCESYYQYEFICLHARQKILSITIIIYTMR